MFPPTTLKSIAPVLSPLQSILVVLFEIIISEALEIIIVSKKGQNTLN